MSKNNRSSFAENRTQGAMYHRVRRYQNVGRSGFWILPFDRAGVSPDYDQERHSSFLVYLIEQFVRVALIIMLLHATIYEMAPAALRLYDVTALARNSVADGYLANMHLAYTTFKPFLFFLIGMLFIGLFSLRGHYFSEGAKLGEVTILKFLIMAFVVLVVGNGWYELLMAQHIKSQIDSSAFGILGTRDQVSIYGVFALIALAKWGYDKINGKNTLITGLLAGYVVFWFAMRLVPYCYYSTLWLLEFVGKSNF